MKRTLVIGDIHGGLRALKQVFERAAVVANDRLVFLGDYVDGWSESAQVVDYVIDLSGRKTCIFIKGNHDVWCEGWLRSGKADSNWLAQGGQATVDSYRNVDEESRYRHLVFFEQMPYFYVDEENRLFIHAGYTSIHGPDRESQQSNFIWDRTLWEMALTMDKRIEKDSLVFPKRLRHFEEIYIGHTPTINYNVDVPMNGYNVWNIDTGAAFTGKLTIMDINTKKYWQSDPVRDLYPGEKGRNKG